MNDQDELPGPSCRPSHSGGAEWSEVSTGGEMSPYLEGGNTPPVMLWATNLQRLLDDGDGCKLFQQYLQAEGCPQVLEFYFACKGIEMLGPGDRQKEVIVQIYKFYVRAGAARVLPPAALAEETRSGIRNAVRNHHHSASIYSPAMAEVYQFLTMCHAAFVESDIYLQYVNNASSPPHEDQEGARSSSASSNCGDLEHQLASTLLSTVPEESCDVEGGIGGPPPLPPKPPTMCSSHSSSSTSKSTRRNTNLDSLTPRNLASTIEHREKLSATPRSTMQRPLHPYHTTYVPKVTPSARDSEHQSAVSSGADTALLTDSSVFGSDRMSDSRTKHNTLQLRTAQAHRNKDRELPVPRTERPAAQRKHPDCGNPKSVKIFHSEVCGKLEALRHKIESEAKLNKCLKDLGETPQDSRQIVKELAVQAEQTEDNELILEAHIDNLDWGNDSRKESPHRSPGAFVGRRRSPGSSSPDRKRALNYPANMVNQAVSMALRNASTSKAHRHCNIALKTRTPNQRPNPNPRPYLSDTSGIESGGSSGVSLISAKMPNAVDKAQVPDWSIAVDQKRVSTIKSIATCRTPKDNTSSLSRRPRRSEANPTADYLHVCYHLPNESVPYVTKFAGRYLTLKQFKQIVPPWRKGGQLRYFFFCQSEEFGREVQKEVCEDSEELPLHAGKIHAKIVCYT